MSATAKVDQTITKYVFKVSGCMDVKQLAESKDEATRILKRMWPRSTLEFLREEFSHKADAVVTFKTKYNGTGEVRKGRSKLSSVSKVSAPAPARAMSLEDVINNELS